MKRIRGFLKCYALYKSTFYLLTYLQDFCSLQDMTPELFARCFHPSCPPRSLFHAPSVGGRSMTASMFYIFKAGRCPATSYRQCSLGRISIGQLIIRKISKIGATRCQILGPKCIKFDSGWGSVSDPAEEAYSALPET